MALKDQSLVLALPIFPVRLQTSIFGASELNFRVRNGNGWTLTAINTDYCNRFCALPTAAFVERKWYYTTLNPKMQVFFSKKLKFLSEEFFAKNSLFAAYIYNVREGAKKSHKKCVQVPLNASFLKIIFFSFELFLRPMIFFLSVSY